jgi:hypothetical protein
MQIVQTVVALTELPPDSKSEPAPRGRFWMRVLDWVIETKRRQAEDVLARHPLWREAPDAGRPIPSSPP